ncbi:histone-lysine N-methyltransferase SETMAR-like [Argiope bruennichi]|uniref:histone-lysine N-methyltransferase SETMAR-like n=1 Tax=Argiope bruennichi TaxID=94029 RepID=UPI0024942E6E|nr:histone-lysine N-methyltransferase SETMAR-like [Argiope bruennichi]
MVTFFGDVKGILSFDYLEKCRAINVEYNANLLDKFHFKIKEKRPGLDQEKSPISQDNASVHKAAIVMAKLHELKFEILSHAPYSPDMVPSDYKLFPSMKKFLAGRKFCSDIEVISDTTAYFGALEGSSYRQGIQAFAHRWSKYMSLEEDTVEK